MNLLVIILLEINKFNVKKSFFWFLKVKIIFALHSLLFAIFNFLGLLLFVGLIVFACVGTNMICGVCFSSQISSFMFVADMEKQHAMNFGILESTSIIISTNLISGKKGRQHENDITCWQLVHYFSLLLLLFVQSENDHKGSFAEPTKRLWSEQSRLGSTPQSREHPAQSPTTRSGQTAPSTSRALPVDWRGYVGRDQD